jgi:hypothetical protein
MFENLTEKLQRTFKNLRGQGKLTEEHLDAALAEIREALLEGDVNVTVADELLANIRQKSIGSEVMLQLSPDQQVVKTVRDELTAMLGKHAKPLFASRPPSVWMIVGLQGSGKTTTAIVRWSSLPTSTAPPPANSWPRSRKRSVHPSGPAKAPTSRSKSCAAPSRKRNSLPATWSSWTPPAACTSTTT